jgi:hypothetical protein
MLPGAFRALSSVAGVMLLVTGCAGGSRAPAAPTSSAPAFKDLTGRQIAAEAAAELKKVSSIHLEGKDRFDGTPSRMDIAVDKDGTCVGSFELPRSSFEVIHAHDGGWFLQGNAGYWKRFGPPQHKTEAAARFANRWLHVDGEELSRDLKDVCDVDRIRTEILPDDTDECVKTVGGPATDEPTVQVWCGLTHVWVGARAPHRPVKYETRDGQEKVDVADYDQRVEYGLPPDKDILDLTDSELV